MVRRSQEQWGQLDILVNGAGLMVLGPIAGAETEDWCRMISTNLFYRALDIKERKAYRMNKVELEEGLLELDAALTKAFPGESAIECMIVGGACLIFLDVTNRATEDIDVVIFNLMDQEESTLVFETPLVNKIRRLIKSIGRRKFGLKGDHSLFFNDNCSPFLLELSNNELPPIRLLKRYSKLHLYVPDDLRYILALKLMAGRPAKDHDDIYKLCARFGIQTRAQAKRVVDTYFPSIRDQYEHRLPKTLQDLFDD
jgi:hypothetical protein